MSQLSLLRHIARQSPAIALARLRHGPARPSWSFAFELAVAGMRKFAIEHGATSWEAQRVAFDRLSNPYSPVLRRVTREDETVSGVRATWFIPKLPARTEATVLYFHGGGYVFGSVRSHAELVARIALASPARVLVPEYRLAPEHPFPAANEDAIAVYRALLARGVDPKRLVLAGDSAGGNLTLATLLRLRDAGEPLPAAAVLVCPWTDLGAVGGSLATNGVFDWPSETVGRTWTHAYLNGRDPADPYISPAHGDLRGLPPLLVQVGGADLLRDQGIAIAERAKASGVDARLVIEPDMVHDWHTFAGVFAHCARAIDDAGAFVREATRT